MTDDEYQEAIKKVHSISIYDLAEKLYPGVTLSKSCLSPFRDDRRPSFGVDDDGKLWCDNTTGEGGNVVHFYMKAKDCDKSTAFKDLLEMAQGYRIDTSTTIKRMKEVIAKERVHPDLERPSDNELLILAVQRNLSFHSLSIAVERGFLWSSTLREQRAWVVTDSSRRCYQARRLDGQPWEASRDSGVSLKCYTLPGSQGNWPGGALEAASFPAIAICEGAPDFLTAFHYAYIADVSEYIAPVCITAASIKKFPHESWLSFVDKKIRIFAHNDEPGVKAAEEWRTQFARIAKQVDVYSFEGMTTVDGEKVIDLNDFTKTEFNRETITEMMQFIYD